MSNTIRARKPLSSPWPAADPFLFCAFHLDAYPASDGAQGVPRHHLGGRDLGSDFSGRDGFSLYHGAPIPGFPAHPHRGFETVTVVQSGLVDHSDSLGATARYGQGDVQWLTAGGGVMHSEMFPLASANADNPLDLYQIWLNLPPEDKRVPPAFTMLWAPTLPQYRQVADNGATATVKIIAGRYAPVETGAELIPPAPPRASWAAREDTEVAIWLVILEPGAALTLPPARDPRCLRTLYFHLGSEVHIAGTAANGHELLEVDPLVALPLYNPGRDACRVMVMQGVPIRAPVAAMGPFVMNTQQEIRQAHADFQRTGFGGWPWPVPGPVHPLGQQRFALYPGSSQVDYPPAG